MFDHGSTRLRRMASASRWLLVIGATSLLVPVTGFPQSGAPVAEALGETVDPTLPAPFNVCPSPGSGAVSLNWDRPSNARVVAHLVEHRAVGSTTWTQTQTAGTGPATIAGLVNGDPYEFRVAALDVGGARSDWGSGCRLEWGDGSSEPNPRSTTAVARFGVEDVALSYTHACALLTTGRVTCWGANGDGQLGYPFGGTAAELVGGALANASATDVAVGDQFSCALLSTGSVACWGDNAFGELGNGLAADSPSPVLVTGGALSGKQVVDIDAMGLTACALASDGSVACWGAVGEDVNHQTTVATSPSAVTGAATLGRSFTQLSVGLMRGCGLLDDGTAVCWGRDAFGETGTGSVGNFGRPADLTPWPVDTAGVISGRTFAGIDVGTYHTCALLDDSTPVCWGNNQSGQLGTGSTDLTGVPSAVAVVEAGALAGRTIVDFEAGDFTTCALLDNGTVACWGYGITGALGNGSLANSTTPVLATGVTGTRLRTMGGSCAVDALKSMRCWGLNSVGHVLPLGPEKVATPVVPFRPPLGDLRILRQDTSATHACALDRSGDVRCFGSNANGQLGDGTTASTVDATVVSGGALVGRNATDVQVGLGFSCALDSTGAVSCWGSNDRGQLGNGTQIDSSVPVAVNGGVLDGLVVTALSVGDAHACAVTAVGLVACWGDNSIGQVGDGSATSVVPSPVSVTSGALSGRSVTDVSAGADSTCAVTDLGTVACWGSGANGKLGNGATSSSASPVSATEGALVGRSVRSVVVGAQHACAVSDANELVCWGLNTSGQLGTQALGSANAGVLVESESNVATVALGTSATCVTTTDARIRCFGDNSVGQLGRHTTGGSGKASGVGGRLFGASVDALSLTGAAASAVWSGVSVPGEGPTPPRNVAASLLNLRNVKVTWSPPTFAGVAGATGYIVEMSPDDGRTWQTFGTTGGSASSLTASVPRDAYWLFRVAATSGTASSDWQQAPNDLLVWIDPKTTKASVSVKFQTPSGSPIVGSNVMWTRIDNVLSSAQPTTTDATGTALFPLLASGAVRFTLTGGQVGSTGVQVQTATVGTVVSLQALPITMLMPPPPTVTSRYIDVVMPDSSPVPGTVVSIFGGLTGTTATGAIRATATWAFPGFTSSPVTDELGRARSTGFAAPSVGADVEATFNDGVLLQRSSGALADPGLRLVFEQMSVIKVSTPDATVVDPGAPAAVTVVALDPAGDPIPDASLTLSSSTSKLLAQPRAIGTSSCGAKLSGTTNASGSVTFVVCPTTSQRWRADGPSIVASKPVLIAVKPAPSQLTAGATHSCARTVDSTVSCWGGNSSGQLGNGTTITTSAPTKVPSLSKVSSVSAGNAFTCAVVSSGASGQARCWGLNSSGQLGNGSLSRSTAPTTVTSVGTTPLSGVVRLSAGFDAACAVLSNATARCWGSNAYGQVGDGTLTRRTRPTTVRLSASAALTGVSSVAAGTHSACAVMSNGAVRCWGRNTFGQLGNNSTVSSRYAVLVSGIDGVRAKATAVVVGNGFACARLTDSTIRCWGRNASGQLGNGLSTDSKVPVIVSISSGVKLTGAVSMSAGASHVCVVTGSGASSIVRCWGSNSFGQLGNGTSTSRRFATALSSTLVKGASQVACGGGSTLAVVPSLARPPSAGTSWGLNSTGQLGLGGTVNRLSPAVISRL